MAPHQQKGVRAQFTARGRPHSRKTVQEEGIGSGRAAGCWIPMQPVLPRLEPGPMPAGLGTRGTPGAEAAPWQTPRGHKTAAKQPEFFFRVAEP